MTMKEIAAKLNELSVEYKIGDLQEIRRKLNEFKNKPPRTIFGRGVKDDYAFHRGGRKELQFNIGYEREHKFRYGVAFSLETSQFFNELEILFKKIERYNEYFRKHPGKFDSYSGFTEKKRIVGEKYPVDVITKEQYTKHENKTFFFIGKYFDKRTDEITTEDCHTILKTFDDLLDLYLFVELKNSDAK